VANPANCSQGSRSIVLDAKSGDQHGSIMSDYDALGEEGGGTLYLGPGTFTVDETLAFQTYGNVSIQGSGMGRTTLTLPADPVGNFSTDNGSTVGQYDYSTGGAINGTTANFIMVTGSAPIDNFEICGLAIDAQANNASEDWSGSLIYDNSGGSHHVYSDISEEGFFGPSTTPNGLHLEGAGNGRGGASGYVIDGLQALDNSVPYENYSGYKGGPNFLNVGGVTNCTLDQVVGIGLAAFEVAPARGCLIENWTVAGHMLIDPSSGGSWGGTVFKDVTVSENGTPAPNALGISVNNGSGGESSNFTDLSWEGDSFVGTVLGGPNMVDVQNSSFWGGIDPTPPVFVNNWVYWADQSPNRLTLPIVTQGAPTGGDTSVVSGDTFVFPGNTLRKDPFELTVGVDTWAYDSIKIAGAASTFLLSAPGLLLSASSSFSHLTYVSAGNGSPVDLLLFDVVGSPGFLDEGAAYWALSGIFGDLPEITPSPVSGLAVTALTPLTVSLAWDAAAGPVTNYTVLSGPTPATLTDGMSAGNRSAYVVTGLAPDEAYYFAIVAWNGTHESVVSASIGVVTPNWAPGVPTGLSVTSAGTLELGLEWASAAGNVTNYSVLVGTAPSSLTVHDSVGNLTTYELTGLHAGTTYYLSVEAWNGTWASGIAAPVRATTLTPPGTAAVGPAPLTLNGWLAILATLLAIAALIVAPILVLSLVRSGRRASPHSRGDRRRRSSGQR
jgi:hypothetical protein